MRKTYYQNGQTEGVIVGIQSIIFLIDLDNRRSSTHNSWSEKSRIGSEEAEIEIRHLQKQEKFRYQEFTKELGLARLRACELSAKFKR